jgi:hypothetical protein
MTTLASVQQLTQQQQNQLVADPQRLDSYAYGRGNPLAEYDTNGRQAVQVTGAVIGDVVGIGSQLYSDLSTGQTSGVSRYIASGLGGAVNGAVVASGGYWYGPLGGFFGGGAQSTISQAAGVLKARKTIFLSRALQTAPLVKRRSGLSQDCELRELPKAATALQRSVRISYRE